MVSLQGAAAIQQPAVGEAPAGRQGVPECCHTGAVLRGRACWSRGAWPRLRAQSFFISWALLTSSASPAGGLCGRGDSSGGRPPARGPLCALLPPLPPPALSCPPPPLLCLPLLWAPPPSPGLPEIVSLGNQSPGAAQPEGKRSCLLSPSRSLLLLSSCTQKWLQQPLAPGSTLHL